MPRSSSAPPPSDRSNNRCAGSMGTRNPKSASTTSGSPMTSSPSRSASREYAGRNRLHIASMQKTPLDRAAAAMRSAWGRLIANGFSHSTGLPAPRNSRVSASWRAGGRPRGTSLRAETHRKDSIQPVVCRVGLLPSSRIGGGLVGFHRVVRRAASGQPPPGSHDYRRSCVDHLPSLVRAGYQRSRQVVPVFLSSDDLPGHGDEMPSRGAGSVLTSKGTSDASTVLESSIDRSVANSTARSPSSDRRPAVLDPDTTAVPTSDPAVKGTSRPIGGPVPCEHIPVMTPNAM